MITHISHAYQSLHELDSMLCSSKVANAVAASSAVLVQVFSADANPGHFQSIAELVNLRMPAAILVGATTVGEVVDGRSMTGGTVIGITCFSTSSVTLIEMSCAEADAWLVGAELGRRFNQCPGKIAGVLLLATPLSIDAASLLQGIESTAFSYPIFGGGAGDYAAMVTSLVASGQRQYTKGVVAVVLAGDDLHVSSSTYLGWRPLSKPMRVTEVEQLLVKTVDGMPAFDVYRRYLNIPNDENFFLNALEFPFLLEREGESVARVPIAATPDGALQFVADVRQGEIFRVGYGDIDVIIRDAADMHRTMREFLPQAIFLYTCGCRRFLMQNDVELETIPFESIAPTFGFYTYGEFFSSSSLMLLNSTMVAVGLREGEPQVMQPRRVAVAGAGTGAPMSEPSARKPARIVSRLMSFITTVTSELEASNREITKLAQTDRLTQLANRARLDQVLEENLQIALRYAIPFSIVLLDLDHFKQVNDTHGHLNGDDVLVAIARLLASNTRNVDTVGRWGGEEFLLIIPNAAADDAVRLAEKLRVVIETHAFPVVGHQTGSFGVSSFMPGDSVHKLIGRADVALYKAKQTGRNRVIRSDVS